jgi:uncharacterized protein (TIGR03437 family)
VTRPAVLLILLLARPLAAQELQTVQVASGIAAPTDIQHAGDGSGRLFLVQQAGLIRILKNGTLLAQPFLDISGRVSCCGERGLLGLAFPPGYATSGRFYVNYTNTAGHSVIAQYSISANPDAANPASEIILLTINQPFANHNGGQIRFGPDGFLYIATGDGGNAGDPQNNGQRLDTLLGKILRVDVESQPGQVRIPPGNPFVNAPGARGEIWAYGLRNPWRFSFDRANGDLWIGDVGQNLYEEIDYQPAASRGGENYGWRLMEGLHCYNAATCNMQGLTLPVLEYPQTDGACSVTGGFVYRGRGSPGMRGLYLYGDYCNGRIWALERQGPNWVNRLMLASGFLITTFGEDEAGEIYVADARSGGRIFRLVGQRAPRFVSAAVTNAASFQPGMVAGSLATVFVWGVLDDDGVLAADRIPLPFSLGDVSLTVDGIPAPILAVANRNGVEQVNFQVPWEITGRTQAPVVFTRDGFSSAAVSVPVLAHQPGVFTWDGSEAIVVHNQGYTLVTAGAPLEAGEFAFLYAEGAGAVTNRPPTGAGAPTVPLAEALAGITVTLGGVPCEVPFAGLAPGFVGLYQINFRVPQGVPSGLRNLVVTVAGLDSPAVTTRIQ